MTFWVAGAVVGSSLLGGSAAESAASTQAAASDRAAELQRQTAQEQIALQKRMYEEGVARQQPWLTAGTNALTQMQGGAYALPKAFTGKVDLTQDPGYAFRMSEGLKALDRQAAARGGLISGAALKGAQRYGQDLASQEYGNAYQRALDIYNADVNRSTTGYNRLASMAGIGQTTAQNIGSAGQTMAQNVGSIASTSAGNIGDLMTSSGAARASGYVGQANALTGALNTGLNYYQNQQLMNRLMPTTAATTYPSYQVPYTANIG